MLKQVHLSTHRRKIITLFFSRYLLCTSQKTHTKFPAFLFKTNICHLIAGDHWLHLGWSFTLVHSERICWPWLLCTSRIAIACSCNFSSLYNTDSLFNRSLSHLRKQNLENLVLSLFVVHFHSSPFSSCRPKQKTHHAQVLAWEECGTSDLGLGLTY